MPDMDSQIQKKTYEKTPISPFKKILMSDLQLTSILVFFDWRSNLLRCIGAEYMVCGVGSTF